MVSIELSIFTELFIHGSTNVVIDNVDDGLLISLAVICDQQRSAVGPAIHIVLRPSNV